jgi:hypothetical protein
LIEELKGISDVVLFDSPPALVVTDAAILGTKVDGAMLVYDAGRTRRTEAQRAAGELRRVGARLLGAVLNRLSGRRGGYYYYYRYYYYETGEGGRRRRRHRRRPGPLGGLFRESGEPAIEAVPDEVTAQSRRTPAWAWVLLAASVLLTAVALLGYIASWRGLLPSYLSPARVVQATYYLGIGAAVMLAAFLLAVTLRRSGARDVADGGLGDQQPDGAGLSQEKGPGVAASVTEEDTE